MNVFEHAEPEIIVDDILNDEIDSIELMLRMFSYTLYRPNQCENRSLCRVHVDLPSLDLSIPLDINVHKQNGHHLNSGKVILKKAFNQLMCQPVVVGKKKLIN